MASSVPAAITDLAIISHNTSPSPMLRWTVPQQVDAYEIRYHHAIPLTEATWSQGTPIAAPPPGPAGNQQILVVESPAATTRSWFAIKSRVGAMLSPISNSPATLCRHITEVNVWLFNQSSYDARNRRLLRIIQPDYVERAAFEWVGTALQDRDFDGVRQSLERLVHDGTLIGSGVDALYWFPLQETVAPDFDRERAYGGPTLIAPDIAYLKHDTPAGQQHLIFKAQRQIDSGFYGIEFDEYDHADPAGVTFVMNSVRAYAHEHYGRTVYLSTNSRTYGGQDFAMTDPLTTQRGEAVDFYIRNYPFRLQGDKLPYEYNHHSAFDGTFNLIPALRVAAANAAPKPFFYFIDFSAPDQFGAPDTCWPQFLRIAQAQILAAGAFPGHGRSFYNTTDSYERGIFTLVANAAKFLREHAQLWHDLAWITPDVLNVAPTGIWVSVLKQAQRTIVHLVNGNYDNRAQVMLPQVNITVSLALDEQPTAAWSTTPDLPAHARRQDVSCTYQDGRITFTLAHLLYHRIIVLEAGEPYVPVSNPTQVFFPYPAPTSLPISNTFHFVAIANEGATQALRWFVNDREGGDAVVGTISDGRYTAPMEIPPGERVTIRAVSMEVSDASAETSLQLVPARTLPWQAEFRVDDMGQVPLQWAIVQGRGDWSVTQDDGKTVLHNHNLADGAVQGGAAGYSALITGGDQQWTRYRFGFRVKPVKSPLVWYGQSAHIADTYVGAVVCFQDTENLVEYRWCYDNVLRCFHHKAGHAQELGLGVIAPFPLQEVYNAMEIHVAAGTIQVWQAGRLVRTELFHQSMQGGIGFTTNFTENYFADIDVKEIEAW